MAVPVVAGVCGGQAVLAVRGLLRRFVVCVEGSALSFAIVFLFFFLVSTPGFSSGVALVVLGFNWFCDWLLNCSYLGSFDFELPCTCVWLCALCT